MKSKIVASVLMLLIMAMLFASIRISSVHSNPDGDILWQDGFESGATSAWDEINGDVDVTSNSPINYIYSANITETDKNYHSLKHYEEGLVISFCTWWRFDTIILPSDYSTLYIMNIDSDGGEQLLIGIANGTGPPWLHWRVVWGDAGGTGWSFTNCPAEGSVFLLEAMMNYSGSELYYTLYVNQTLAWEHQYYHSYSEHVSSVSVGSLSYTGSSCLFKAHFDDCVVGDGYLGCPFVGAPTLDTTPPDFTPYSVDYTTNIMLSDCNFTINVTDNAGVSGYVFSIMNNTLGTWYNSTWQEIGGSPKQAQITAAHQIPNLQMIVKYEFYANDTSDNWGASGEQTTIQTVFMSDITFGTLVGSAGSSNPSGVRRIHSNNFGYTYFYTSGYATYSVFSPDGITWLPESVTVLVVEGGDDFASYMYENHVILAYHTGEYSIPSPNNWAWIKTGTQSFGGGISWNTPYNFSSRAWDLISSCFWDGDEVVYGYYSFAFAHVKDTSSNSIYFVMGCTGDFSYDYSRLFVFKTTDFGTTWSDVGIINPNTGNPTSQVHVGLEPDTYYDEGFLILFRGRPIAVTMLMYMRWNGASFVNVEYDKSYGTISAITSTWTSTYYSEEDRVYLTAASADLYYFNNDSTTYFEKHTGGGGFGLQAPLLSHTTTSLYIVGLSGNDVYKWQYQSGSWDAGALWCKANHTISGFSTQNYAGGRALYFAWSFEVASYAVEGSPVGDPPNISIISVAILNRDCLDSENTVFNGTGWLVAEHKYYEFQMNFTLGTGSTLDCAGFKFYDTANNEVIFFYQNSTSTAIFENGTDFASLQSNASLTYNNSSLLYTLTINLGLKKQVIDSWYVDLYALANVTAGTSTGWILEIVDYFNIYSQGGLEKMTTSGDAGRLDGGDFFNLWAGNDSYAMSETYWRNLVHAKMLMSLDFKYLGEDFGNVQWEFGFDYYARGHWLFPTYGPSIDISLTEYKHDANWRYAKLFVVYRNRGAAITTEYLYAYWTKDQTCVDVWVDLWFNKANASSIFGFRTTAYFYAVSNNDFWTLFTGGSWGPTFTNTSTQIMFSELKDYWNTKLYSHEIELIKFWAKVTRGHQEQTSYCSIHKIPVFDFTFSSEMSGMQTPTFEEPRTPAVPLGGVYGILASFLQALVNALAPAFSFLWSGMSYILDSVLQFLTGQPNVFTNFVNMVIAVIASIVTFMATLAANIVSFASVVVNTVTWFFSNFFVPLWGIINFLLIQPAFNVFTAFSTMLGIIYAWLGGTTYTNGWGQTYNFTNLSTLHWLGLSGGIVIMMIIFVFGFFIQFLGCIASLSLNPILEPLHLFWTLVNFIITIIVVIADLIQRFILLLVQIAHALRDIAPRPFGF